MSHYGITPSLATAFLQQLDDDAYDAAHRDLSPFIPQTRGLTTFATIARGWPQNSDEIASVLRKHGYDAWGWGLPATPAELTAVPYQLHALTISREARPPEYVTGYLTPDSDDGPGWLDAQLARVRAALPVGWCASWLATDLGDTRIVVRPDPDAPQAAQPAPSTRAGVEGRP